MQVYFAKLQKALAAAGLAEPVLLIDRRKLDKNIKQLKTHAAAPYGLSHCCQIAAVCGAAGAYCGGGENRSADEFQSRNEPTIIGGLAAGRPAFGQAFACRCRAGLFDALPAAKGKLAARRIQWLIDTPQRLKQYEALAKKLGLKLRINLEVDVGLHRGGMMPGDALDAALTILAASNHLSFAGYLGYEPHLTKIPTLDGWRGRAQKGAQKAYAHALRRGARISARHILRLWCGIWRAVRLSVFIKTLRWQMSWRLVRRW